MVANYECIVPRRRRPTRAPALYGHGLLGEASEVDLPPQRAMVENHDFIYCATDWKGMATEDVPTVGTILNDLSRFPMLTDRAPAGDPQLPLPRPADDPPRRASTPTRRCGGKIDTRRLFYDGNSQGGIYGGTLTAVSPDVQRSVLGVPAMNYSTLLQRSVDFDQYGEVLYASYPKEIERPLLFSLIQQLWDRSDPNGYAQHMTTQPVPEHAGALGADADGGRRPPGRATSPPTSRRARSARRSASTRSRPAAATTCTPFFADRCTCSTSRRRASLVYEPWDAGAAFNSLSPNQNTPPVASASNQDPHGVPRRTPAAQQQKSDHLRIDGTITDRCGGGPCQGVP